MGTYNRKNIKDKLAKGGEINLGESNGRWKGGVNEDYCIRIAYDNYPHECAICRLKSPLEIHHKDRNRKNNNVDNLIILCKMHHGLAHRALNGWSKKYIRCRRCGRTEKKHNAKGYCVGCYSTVCLPERIKEYYVKNKKRLDEKKREYYKQNRDKILRRTSEYRNKKKLEGFHSGELNHVSHKY